MKKTTKQKKIIVVGGGVAGLTAGIYALQQGFDVTIYERHTQVGGLCTGWDRQGYHVDGCIHWVTGSNPKSNLRKLWDNVGALKDIEIIQKDYFDVYEVCGSTITLWRDINRLEADLLKLSPLDKRAIKRFIKDIKSVQKMIVPSECPVNLMNPIQLTKQLWSMKGMIKVLMLYNSVSVQQYAKKFAHPAIRRMFEICMPNGYSVAAFIFTLATFTKNSGGIPKGGSLKFANRMADRFTSLGGKLFCNTLITQTLINNNKAIGVEYINNEGKRCCAYSDYVVLACDVNTSMNILLKGNYTDKAFVKRFRHPKIYETQSCFMAVYAIEKDLSEYPASLVVECEKYRVGITDYTDMCFQHYAYEPSFAPEGHTVLNVLISQGDYDYKYWENIYFNKKLYKSEKQRIADFIQKVLEERYPELIGKIKLIDVLSPMTFKRYCSSYHGAWMAFRMGKGTRNLMHTGKIKGLSNCYLTGQWLQPPGGLPVALTMGKFTIQRICKKEKMNYRF